MQEAVERRLGPEREQDRHRRSRHGDGAIRAGAPTRARRCRGRAPRGPETACRERARGIDEALRQASPELRAGGDVRRQRRRVGRDRLERELLALERPHAQVGRGHGPQQRGRQQHGDREAAELDGLQAAQDRDEHRDAERRGRDRAEVDRREPLEREHQPDDERAAQRAALPEAVERDEREREEQRDLRVQVRQPRPAVRSGREERPRHEGGEAVAGRAPHQQLDAEAGEQQARERARRCRRAPGPRPTAAAPPRPPAAAGSRRTRARPARGGRPARRRAETGA